MTHRLALMVLQRARDPVDLVGDFVEWTDVLSEVIRSERGLAALEAVIRYALPTRPQPSERWPRGWCRSSATV